MATAEPLRVTTLQEFLGVVARPGLTVVDFSAEWCGPCAAIAPVVLALAGQFPAVTFVKVDVDRSGEIAQRCRVTHLPTFVFFKSGAELPATRSVNPSALKLAATVQENS